MATTPTRSHKTTEDTPQALQNLGFDTTFNVSGIELLGHDSVNNVLRRIQVDGAGQIKVSGLAETYVPYTGATGNVDIGAHRFIGDSLMVGANILFGTLEDHMAFSREGYETDQLSIEGSVAGAVLDLSSLTDNRVFLFPDKDGTFAMLSDITANVSNDVYGAGWDNVTDLAPSQNAVYDKIETLAGGHDVITLDANADTLLSLSAQELGLDVQGINKVLIGPVSGGSAVPTFRILDEADIPVALPNLTITESQISDLQAYLTAETDPVFVASEAYNFAAGDKTKLDGIAAGAEVNVQSDWDAVAGDAQILNKPDLSGLTYKGVLDASGGSYPGSPSQGDYYIISVAGTIDGTTYAVSDWATYNGASWDKIDNTTLVVTASNGVKKVGNDIQIDSITNAMLAGFIADSKLSTISTADKVNWAAVNKTGSIIDDIADVNAPSPTDDQALAYDTATSKWIPQTLSGSGSGSITYTKNLIADTSEVTVGNTAVSTKIYEYTVPANTLSTDKILRVTVTGTYINNSGATKTLNLILYYGGTAAANIVATTTSATIASAAGTGSFTAEFFLIANGATNAQTGSAGATVKGGSATAPVIFGASGNQIAIDSTLAKTLYVYAKHSVANASTTLTGQLMNIELLNVTESLKGEKGDTGAGASDGDKGDITVSGSGATWTIDNEAVTLAKMANMATASLIYRKTAAAGVPEVNTLATLKTDLGLTGTNSGDQTIASLGLDADLATFSLPASTTISTFGASLIDDAAAANAIATLGLDADIATLSLPASTTISTFGASLIDDAAASNAIATLGLDADLATLSLPASTTITAAAATILDDASVAAIATTLGLGTLDGPTFAHIHTDQLVEVTAAHGIDVDSWHIKDGGAGVITGGTNTFNITNGTASLDIAASSAVDINANLTVETASLVNQDLTSDAGPTFDHIHLVAGSSLYADHQDEVTAAHGVVCDGVQLKDGGALAIVGGSNTFDIANGTAHINVAASSYLDVNANLTVETASLVNQDLTSDASPTFVSPIATTAWVGDAASGYDVGSTSLEVANVYVGTGRVYFGAGQASSIYDSGTALIITRP